MVNTRIEMGLTPPIAKVMMSVEDGVVDVVDMVVVDSGVVVVVVVVVEAKVQEDDVQSAAMAERANS